MQKTSMHVLVIPTWYPNGKDKLIGIYHKQFAEALATSGCKVGMLYIDRQGVKQWPRYPFMKKRYRISENGYVTYARRMPDLTKISYSLQMKSYRRVLDRLLREYIKDNGRPDVLHAQVAVPAGYAAVSLGKKYGIPVVITEHASYFERFFTGREGQYCRYALENADAVTCVGDFMLEGYKRHGIKATVLPNIVDCSIFRQPKTKADDGRLHLITVSALRPGKRIDDAIMALKRLKEEDRLPDFLYTVVGDGAKEAELKALAEREKMTDNVVFVGRKTREEIAALLAGADVLLMVSDIETFGIPAVEALAAGVPVVSTKCKGPEAFLTPDVSELCPCGSVSALADAIDRMVKRLATISEETVRATADRYDAPAVAQSAKELYADCLSRKKSNA